MGDSTIRSRVRRRLLLLVPAAATASLLSAQKTTINPPSTESIPEADGRSDLRLPNGKRQIDEILKDDYEKNLKDARDLTDLAKSFELDLEKNEAFVFSLVSLKKLDDMEKLTKRIRSRMKRL